MDATVILIDSEAELKRARALVERLWDSRDPADTARLEAQAQLIATYEQRQWPRRAPRVADLLRYLMDEHGLTRADMVPILGTPSRVSEILRGKKTAEHGDGAAAARPVPRAGRPAAAFRRFRITSICGFGVAMATQASLRRRRARRSSATLG